MSHASPSPNSPTNNFKLPPWLMIVLVLGFLGVAWYQTRQEKEAAPPREPIARHEPVIERPSDPPESASREILVRDKGRDQPVLAEVTPEPGSATSREKPTTATGRSPTETRAGPTASTKDRTSPGQQTSSRSPIQPTNDPRRDGSVKKSSPATTAQLDNQTIRDFGKVVYKGTIDLQPTLDRIARGEKNTHRNDGWTFGNRERRLPQKPSGYYTEYVHPTKGLNGPGPQRVIFGKGGDIWYTPDHYETFKKIK